MSARPSTSARLLAPLALAVCAVAVLIVIGSSTGGGDDSSDGNGSAASTSTQSADTKTTTTPRRPATYTVESGDTLGGIAEETGVSVDTLQELNPELDPQALIAGQKIKLRE